MEVICLRLHTDFTNNYVMLIHTHSHITSSRVPFPLTEAVPRSENGSRPEGTRAGNLGTKLEPKAQTTSKFRLPTSPASRAAATAQVHNLERQGASSSLKAQEGVCRDFQGSRPPLEWPVSLPSSGPHGHWREPVPAAAPEPSPHSQLEASVASPRGSKDPEGQGVVRVVLKFSKCHYKCQNVLLPHFVGF